ncbi:ferric reduction oxidase 2-like [Impatiens glandulifera]|uniref:ferric reduction oxidase 2-like n=1 Tax=Impatiens glandulifera TaxID=253017 RepID=UPI001FB092A4|nr:ferric reduction oxidase 2-like [Impatiens glandulifera]
MELRQGISMLLLTIKLLALVIFLGYLTIWIMMPTNTFYLHWMPNIHSKVDSTFIGEEGSNILIYTFPILFISILGGLYLHLGQKYGLHREICLPSNPVSSFLKRPALVRGPLGIVSWTELSFFVMFVVLLVWSFFAYLYGLFIGITPQSATKMGETVWEDKLETAALLLGLVGNICLGFLFFPVTRGSSILRLIGLTSDASIKYHIWVGHIVMSLFTAHGFCFVIFWANTNRISEMLKWEGVRVSNLAGEIALIAGLAMWITSFTSIRRKIFELFYYTHHLYVIFIIFYVFHIGFSHFGITLPGFYLFLVDRYLRFLQSQQKVCLVSARVLPCEVVELSFAKNPGLRYNPTSNIFINVPSISRLQWHPFTVTSNSNMDPEILSIVVKSEGCWTQQIYQTISKSSQMERIEVSTEGPYGPASTQYSSYDKLVLISGGSGITPFISVIRELLFKAGTTRRDKNSDVHLIAVFKTSVELTMLDLLLPVSGNKYDISGLNLSIEAYVTRDKEHCTDDRRLCKTTWFKPSDKDVPISGILGSGNWLWLTAIISSSFIIFLLMIGIITQFYVYHIDHNTDMRYPYSAKSALNILVICFCIAIPATVAFLLNKRQKAKEVNQIQNMDMPTPNTSPGWCNNGNIELESLPYQSLAQTIKVHYGERPKFQKLLPQLFVGCEGCSTAVLVSGPKRMRQDVAETCSSRSSADNLHFESISFTW